ncbi:MAG: hypothetical protein ACI8R4_001129 [Paracoccaceae bacterium]|jgi:hypothetical protein
MTDLSLKAAILCSVLLVPTYLTAQTTTDSGTTASATEDAAGLMTPEELQTLVGPIALYPDTLMIQVLVAATFPFDVMKADRLLKDNPGKSPEELKPLIEIQAWDESVAVLATAFPEVLTEMAVHVDWTETVGNAMLAQSEDVMNAVQVMREIAAESGALTSGDEQTVEVTQDNSGDQTIIIQPTDPEVVYVPQYDPQVVYVDSNNGGGDVLTAGLIAFGTYAVIDAIFDNNDPWNNYWGCRNCGGWGGGPIYRNPNIDIDVDGNVNIGNNIGNNNGWKPDDRRKDKARDDIARKRGPDGNNKLPVSRPDRGDEMRASLSKKSGAADISRSKAPRADVAKSRPAANKPTTRPAGNRSAAAARTGAPAKAKAAVHKPAKARAPAAKAKRSSGGGGLSKRASAPKARSGGSRGRAASGGGRRR